MSWLSLAERNIESAKEGLRANEDKRNSPLTRSLRCLANIFVDLRLAEAHLDEYDRETEANKEDI